MREIYHLVPRDVWEQVGPGSYRAPSLDREGFIHCSYQDQLARVANLFYANEAALWVLYIDPQRLTSPVRDEDVAGEYFPHVYGPINRDAIREVRPLQRDAGGAWVF